MRCDCDTVQAQDLLHDYLALRLDGEALAQLDAHLAGCPSCRGDLELLVEAHLAGPAFWSALGAARSAAEAGSAAAAPLVDRLGEVLAAAAAWLLPERNAFSLEAALAGAMSKETIVAGAHLRLRIAAAPELNERRVVVLYAAPGGDWKVVFPASEEESLRLRDLPEEGGGRAIDLSAGDEPGVQRWAIALPEAVTLDWSVPSSERWTSLREAVLAEATPAAVVDIPVLPRPV